MIQDGICLDDLDVNNFPSLTALSLTVSLLDAYWIVRSWHCVTPGLPWRDSALALSQGSHKWHLTPIATDSKIQLGMMQVRTYEQEMWMSLAVNKHST